MSVFVEVKARKAKFGFNFGQINMENLLEMADFFRSLKDSVDSKTYIIEKQGYDPHSKIMLYTDNEETASWIRNYNL